MKKLLVYLLTLTLSIPSFATDYYFDSENGLDANSGLTLLLPKQTYPELKSLVESAISGDVFYLATGSHYDQVNLTATTSITIRSYGSGEAPILYGSKIVTLSSIGGNKYQAADTDIPAKTIDRKNLIVEIDGQLRQIATEPNDTTWNQVESGGSNYSDDTDESWTANQWQGAYIIGKNVNWGIETMDVTSNTTNRIYHGVFSPWLANGEGYYKFQNHENAADQNYEWWWDTGNLYVFSNVPVTAARVAISDTIISISGVHTLTLENITLKQANFFCVAGRAGSTVRISKCTMEETANALVRVTESGIDASQSKFGYAPLSAVWVHGSHNIVHLDSNYIHHIAHVLGQENKIPLQYSGGGVNLQANGGSAEVKIEYNFFDTIRNAVQTFWTATGGSILIYGNYIRNYGNAVGDFGAIYSGGETYNVPKIIRKNFIIDNTRQFGTMGTNWTPGKFMHALYWDYDTQYMLADSNVIENANLALQCNRGNRRSFKNNVIVNAAKDIHNYDWRTYINIDTLIDGSVPLRYDTIKYNTVVLDGNSQTRFMRYQGLKGVNTQFPNNFDISYNRYYTPFTVGPAKLINLWKNYVEIHDWNLAEWKANTLYPAYGDGSYEDNTSRGAVTVLKNWSTASKDFNLTATYVDTAGLPVTGTTNVAALSSKILFYASGTETSTSLINIDTTLIPMYTGTVSNPTIPVDTCDSHIYTYDTVFVNTFDRVQRRFNFENNLTDDFGAANLTQQGSGAYATTHNCLGSYSWTNSTGNYDGGLITSTSVELGDTFTMSFCWYEDWGGDGILAANQTGSNSGWSLNKRTGGYIDFATYNGTTSDSASTGSGVFNKYTEMTIRVDANRAAGTATITVNGTPQTVDNTILNDFNTNAAIGIAGDNTGTNISLGNLDNFYIDYSDQVNDTIVTVTDSICHPIVGDTIEYTSTRLVNPLNSAMHYILINSNNNVYQIDSTLVDTKYDAWLGY